MHEWSGNRANRRPSLGATVLALLAWLAGAAAATAAAPAGGHGTPPPAAAPEPPKPAAPPPPPKKVLEPLTRVDVPPRVPRMPTDSLTGLAIGGFDPVAYFVDGVAREGRPEFETEWRGAVWRFVNEGNMAAFRDAPEVYTPRFVGLCTFQLARGYAAEARPEEFVIYRQRVYLFATPDHRATFLSNPDQALEQAEKNWVEVARELP